MLLARTELRLRRQPVTMLEFSTSDPLEISTPAQRQAYAFHRGILIIGVLTLWFLGWLALRWTLQPSWLERLPAVVDEIVALVETAGAFTLAFLWAGLGWRYWRAMGQVAGPAPPLLTLDKLQSLSPGAFEQFVASLFRQKGYTVVMRGSSGDLGVDLELTGPYGRRAIVQCKRYQNTIGAEIIRELYGTLVHEAVMWAFLVTTADISDAARDWAAGKPLTLIDGTTLIEVARSLRERKRSSEPAVLDAGPL